MKKVTIMGLILSLISISSFACHFYGGSICHTKAYFHGSFSPNSIFQFRFYGTDTTVVKQFVTGDRVGELDSIIIFDIPDGTTDVKISFRNHYLSDSLFNNWAGNYDAGYYYELIDTTNSECGTLGVTIYDLGVTKPIRGNINVSFISANETGIDHYDILASEDQNKWHKIGEVKATGASKYMATISLTGSAAFIVFGIALYNENKKKYSNKRKWVSFFLLAGMIVLFSCNKIKDTGTMQSYKFIKVATISNTGAAPSYSETTQIK